MRSSVFLVHIQYMKHYGYLECIAKIESTDGGNHYLMKFSIFVVILVGSAN
jgi:hypothetical protein